jgi:hypothetical protein
MDYVAARNAFAPAPAADMPAAGPTVLMLILAAASRPLVWLLGFAGVHLPYAVYVIDVLSIVAVFATLLFVHGAFTAMRGRASFSPGMAVGGWFIPLANLVLPALILRDAWRTSVGKGGGIAFAWMVAWWLTTIMTVLAALGLQFVASEGGPVTIILAENPVLEIPGISLATFGLAYSVLATGCSVAAYGLLALIVQRVADGRAK